MGMTINTNLMASQAYLNLNRVTNDQANSMAKLSSGLRINSAADDAAGLAISQGLQSQVSGSQIAARNAQDGINVVQTTEGALGQVQSILQRVRDLAVQAGNDSNNADSRAAISKEANDLVKELGRIAGSTNFNKINLLDGSQKNMSFQVGADGNANSQINVDLSSANVNTNVTALGSSNKGVDFAITDALASTSNATPAAMTFKIDGNSVTTSGNIAGTTVNDIAASLNADKNFSAVGVASVVRDSSGVATGISIKAIDGGTVDTAAPSATFAAAGTVGANQGGLDFSSADKAQAAISLIDKQIGNVSTSRAMLGSVQNRLSYAVNILNVSAQNLSSAKSHITDVDMAQEMVNYTKDSILSQAGTAMLAQANQSGQGVLKLLG